MSNGGPAIPVWIVPSEELLRNGGTIPVQGGAAVPFTFDGSLEPGQVPQWDGSAFAGVTPVTNALVSPMPGFVRQIYTVFDSANGDNEITPTIPSGYKLLIPYVVAINQTTGAVNYSILFKRSGVSYQLRQSASVGARAASVVSAFPYILEPGDSIVFNTLSTGWYIAVLGFLVPNTDPLKLLISILGSGDNTIHTIPTNKVARSIGVAGATGGLFSASQLIGNSSGGTRIYNLYAVPVSGSPSVENQVGAVSIATANTGTPFTLFQLSAGGSLIVNSDGAGDQVFMGIVNEEDA